LWRISALFFINLDQLVFGKSVLLLTVFVKSVETIKSINTR
jgi:hypothetical protein